ncbi:MAG: hypothetical protein ACXWKN_10685 [Phenylobacterium sp.]
MTARGGLAAEPAPAAAAAPVTDRPPPFTSDDLLLVQVIADNLSLTDDFGVYASRAGLYVPLGELARLIDLSISVDPRRGRAEGFVLSSSRSFVLDLQGRRAQVGDRAVPVADAQALRFEDDIYLRADLVEQLLPLKLKPDLHGLQLVLIPTESLPFQERLALERRRLGLGRGAAEEPVLKMRAPYALFSPPAVDIDLDAEADTRTAGSRQFQFDLAGDLAYSSLRLYVGSDAEARLDTVRLLMDRKDADGRALGPLGLTEISAGDTYTPFLQLGARSVGGRGLAFTSEPLERASVFEKINLRGDLPAGYQVELYINEVLRASIAQSSDGRYDFQDVALSFGLNTVRLVFYGPRGERREEVQRVNVGSGALARCQFVYSFGAVQQDTSLITTGGTDSGAHGPPGFMDPRIVGSAAYGLTDKLTLQAAFARYTPNGGLARDMTSLGLATSAMGLALQAVGAADSRGGAAGMIGVAGRPFGVSTVFRHAEYGGAFADEGVASAGSGLRRDTALDLDFNAPLRWGPWPMSVRAAWDAYAGGTNQISASARLTKPIGRYLLSDSLNYASITGPAGSRQLINETDVSVLVRRVWQLRGGLSFDVTPDPRLQNLFVTIQRDIAQRAALSFSASKGFGPGEGAVLQGAVIWRLKAMDLTFGAGYDTQRSNAFFGLRISTGLLFDPVARAYRAVGPGAATGGALAVHGFVDGNGDGRWEPGEAPVAGISTQSGRRPGATDDKGELLGTGLGDGAKARVYLDASKIDDPYLTPPPAIIELAPRAGRVIEAPYPMTASSEVEVQVLFTRPGEKARGLSALAVQLVSANGAVGGQGRTAYDGTVVIENIRPGVYTLRIDPDQAQRLHMTLKAPVTVKALPSGGFLGRVAAEAVLVSDAPASQGGA